MKSLKNVYKELISEEDSSKVINPDIARHGQDLKTTSGMLYRDNTTSEYRKSRGHGDTDQQDIGVLYGKFSDAANSLWGYRDGSGGRGEYSLVYDILANSLYKSNAQPAQPTDIKSFLKDMYSNPEYHINFAEMLSNESYKFYDLNGNKVNFYCKTQQEFEDKMSELLSFPVECFMPEKRNNWEKFKAHIANNSIDRIAIIKFKGDKPTELTQSPQTSTLKNYITSITFINTSKPNGKNSFSSEGFKYHLIKSVTTSGEESKSCDISIDTSILTDDQKIYFKCSGKNALKIEVKEVNSWRHALIDGIRLGGGSKLAVQKGDLFFALTVIAIGTNVSENSTVDNNEIRDLLIKFKKGEIGRVDFDSLIGYVKDANELVDFLSELIETSEIQAERSAICHNALSMLKSKLKTDDSNRSSLNLSSQQQKPVTPDKRKEYIQLELKDIIFDSLNADWFAICLGKKGAEYAGLSQGDQRGRLEYIMIHKDEYRNFLTTSKISNSGVAYASLTHDSPGWLTQGWQTNESAVEFIRYSNNIIKHNQRKKFINEFKAYCKKQYVLKEVYSYLFDLKKTINEGALGGHMMHPYEALDMTPEQLVSRIKQYGVPQKIIEKVDGQNLFFTVEKDGTLLFARNKEDMTYDDLVKKFTNHGAEKPFVEGGNAIKSGVESLLNNISQEEVIRLFHPSEEIRTFVNFEIMHPEKENQIIYDEKYIVFHGIVNYRNGREEVSRSSQDQRVQELVTLMSSGVSSAGFTLASNREVELNQLTDVQIAEYTQRVYDISGSLGMEEGETLGDGIMNVIGDEIEAEGVTLSDEALTIFTDYIVRGEDSEGRSIASREWTKLLTKEDVVKLRQLGLTSTAKVKTKIGQILQPFKALFVELGIDLLKGVQSSYMSADMNIENVELIRDKLSTAISDLENYISTVPEEEWSNGVKRLIPHMELINRKGLDNIVSSAVEGGVYSANDNLFKVTGGFAPMNQIIGAAYRDNEGIFTTFKEKFMQQENNRRSLRDIFSLIF